MSASPAGGAVATMPRRERFRFLEPLRVRWAEVDMQRIVFNGHYLMYFDTAVAGYWRALALPYAAAMHQLGGDLYVRKATLEYFASARFDERVDVGVRCERIGNSSMLLHCAVFRGPQLLVHGELVYVFADPATQTAKPVPPALRALLLGFEAGEPMLHCATLRWADAQMEAAKIRHEVFTQEQGIAAELDADGRDPAALHVLAHNRLGQAVGTARLLQPEAGLGQIGRMAVLPGARGAGAGRQMLLALLAAARERAMAEVLLHAQADAVGFYAALGFAPQGAVFEEAGLPHQTMRIRL